MSAPTRLWAQATEAWEPPTLTLTRYDEDWSNLADPADRTGHWTEPFKYIPLGDDAFVTTGTEIRLRDESYRHNQWESGAVADDGYLWARLVPHADLHVGRARAFVQPIVAYAIGVAPAAGPVDQTRVDLLQGFVDYRFGDAKTGDMDGTGATLRVGRQMISLGSERLIGTRYGPNVPLAFDGVRGLLSLGGATLSLIAVRPVVPGLKILDDRSSPSKRLWSAYASLSGLDFYYIGYRNDHASFGSVTGREIRHSIGARTHGTAGAWHWNAEGVAQFGRFAGNKIVAWTVGAEGGKRFPQLPLHPDALLRFNIASGDKRAGDGQLNTFNALFPKGKYFGELSPIGPNNIVSANPRVAITLTSKVSASLAAMAYWRYSRADGVYDVPGNLVRAPGGSSRRFIGKEAEATLAWQATAELELSTSLSAFAPGAFIHDTGSAKTITMVGFESNFRF